MNTIESGTHVDRVLENVLRAEVAPLARDIRQACESADLWQVLSFNDLPSVLVDRPGAISQILRPCIARWLGSSFAESMDSASIKLSSLMQGSGQASLAETKLLLAYELDSETYADKAGLLNRLSLRFFEEFCDINGYIDWPKLVEFNSGNMKE